MIATALRWIFGLLTALLALLLALAGLYIGYIFGWQFGSTFYLALDPANLRPVSVGALTFTPIVVAILLAIISVTLFRGLRKKKTPAGRRSVTQPAEKALTDEV